MMASLLARYCSAYASNQFRALQQFLKWLAEFPVGINDGYISVRGIVAGCILLPLRR